jgi:hypothetical protein
MPDVRESVPAGAEAGGRPFGMISSIEKEFINRNGGAVKPQRTSLRNAAEARRRIEEERDIRRGPRTEGRG